MIKSTARIVRKALNRVWFVLVLLLVAYFVSSVLYSLFEGVSLGQSMWWAVVTATTTGYGDSYPVTVPGRIIAGIYMLTMLVLNAFVIGHIVGAVIEDKNLFSHKEQEQLEAMLVLMAIRDGILPEGSTSYPPAEWLREKGMSLQDDSS